MSSESPEDTEGCYNSAEEFKFHKIKKEVQDEIHNEQSNDEQTESQNSENENSEETTNTEDMDNKQDERISNEVRMWSRPEFLRGFIKLYESFPCLWKVDNKKYANKSEKEEAYIELMAFCQSRNATASVDYVKSKINSIRTCYRKELSKVQKSVKLGYMYVPTLWYFNLLSFLKDQVSLCPPKQYLPASKRSIDPVESCNSGQKKLRRSVGENDIARRKRVFLNRNEVKHSSNIRNNSSSKAPTVDNGGDGGGWQQCRFESLADSVSNDLRKMDRSQQLLVENIINRALFLGLMGLLNSSSDIQCVQGFMDMSVRQTDVHSSVMSAGPATLPSPRAVGSSDAQEGETCT